MDTIEAAKSRRADAARAMSDHMLVCEIQNDSCPECDRLGMEIDNAREALAALEGDVALEENS